MAPAEVISQVLNPPKSPPQSPCPRCRPRNRNDRPRPCTSEPRACARKSDQKVRSAESGSAPTTSSNGPNHKSTQKCQTPSVPIPRRNTTSPTHPQSSQSEDRRSCHSVWPHHQPELNSSRSESNSPYRAKPPSQSVQSHFCISRYRTSQTANPTTRPYRE